MSIYSDKMNSIRSDIRGKNYQLSLALEQGGEKVLKLNTGNPPAFGFQMPDRVKNALIQKLDTAVGYCDVRGMAAAREAIMQYHNSKGIHNFSLDNIFIGNGVSEIASMVCTALLSPGDEVLVPTPCYSLWANETILQNAIPVYYQCDESNHWNPNIDHIKSLITTKTKAILIINPNNPTGVLYSDQILGEIAEIARQHNLILWSDEIYDRLVFDDRQHTSIATLAPDLTVITMNGLSKSHCLCGFRCGWAVICGPDDTKNQISDALFKLASMRLSANAIMQTIIPDALADTAYTNAMIEKGGRLYEQRKAVLEELDKIPYLSYVKNDAGFYVFPKINTGQIHITDDRKFAQELLLSQHILVVPGSGFSWQTPDHFRIVMLPEAPILREAIHKIGTFLSELAGG